MDNNKIQIILNDTGKIKEFLNIVRTFLSDIDILTERACLDAKSVLSVYSLDLSKNAYVRIISDNDAECIRFEREMSKFKGGYN